MEISIRNQTQKCLIKELDFQLKLNVSKTKRFDMKNDCNYTMFLFCDVEKGWISTCSLSVWCVCCYSQNIEEERM